MTDDFFADFGETLHQAAKEFTAKTDNFFEGQKMRNKISGEQRQIDQCLKDEGNILYEKFVEGEPLHEDVAVLCEEITEHKMAIAKMRENMARKRGESRASAPSSRSGSAGTVVPGRQCTMGGSPPFFLYCDCIMQSYDCQ